MSTRFYDQQFVGMFPPPKPVPGDGAALDYRGGTESGRHGAAGLGYRRSEADLSLSHGKAVTRVGVDYTIEDGDGIGEVGYLYPIHTLVLVAANRALPVQFLRPGMTFLLEDGGTARVTKVAAPKVLEAPSGGKDGHGNSLGRVLGTVKWTGIFPHFDLHFDDGKIETTPGHQFWCLRRKAWIPACEFKAGDLMRSRQGRPIRVRRVSGIYWEYGSLYNLEVEDHHNYFVGDLGGQSVWAHNGLANGCRVPKAAVVERDPTPAEFEKLAFGRPGRKETFSFPWSESRWGKRRPDDWIEGTGTIQEATTLRWSSLNLEDVHSTASKRFHHKLNQAAQDGYLLRKHPDVNRVVWYGIEPLPTTGRASELTRLLSAEGIEYRVVKVPR